MLSAEENDLLTRVGPGTKMGNLMREYWIPALLSSEVATPGGSPVRLRLLGENLVAFRSPSGKLGMMRDACPHRGASLFFGRNEEEGLRCVYHGWQFNAAGKCVDMPSEPPESNFKHKVCAKAYPCQERNGVIFAYMGPRDNPPPLPEIEPNTMGAQDQVEVWCVMRECNWLQGMEGDIDVSHLGFMHLGSISPEDMVRDTPDYYLINHKAPGHKAVDTDWGTMFGTYYPAQPDTFYWRIGHFILPFYNVVSSGTLGKSILIQAWVPLDDGHCMLWRMHVPASRSDAIGRGTSNKRGGRYPGTYFGRDYLPNTTHWLGRWRLAANSSNDYGVDREAQRTTSYTGIEGIFLQDQALTESMGPIVDRTQEHLGSSDTMIIKSRRRLIRAARDLAEGKVPATVDHPELYMQRAGGVVLPRAADWIEATADLRVVPSAQ